MAYARAGEWHASDPGGGLASCIRWRLAAGSPLPPLITSARLGDPSVLAVPAGGPYRARLSPGELAKIVPSDALDQRDLLVRATASGWLAVAEVALGDVPVLTGHRAVRLVPGLAA